MTGICGATELMLFFIHANETDPIMLLFVIIALNVFVFIAWNFPVFAGPEFLFANFLVSWNALAEGRYWTLVTSVFSHNMLWHLLLNMLVLRSFGPILLATLGTARFLLFYLGAGIVSSATHALVSAVVLGEPSIPALGASGALSGLVLLFSCMFPREKLLLLGLIPVPALIGALIFIGLDLWGLVAQAEGGGLPIGHGAHLGGAMAGILYYLFYMRPRLSSRS